MLLVAYCISALQDLTTIDLANTSSGDSLEDFPLPSSDRVLLDGRQLASVSNDSPTAWDLTNYMGSSFAQVRTTGNFPSQDCQNFPFITHMIPASMMLSKFGGAGDFNMGNSQIEVTLSPCGFPKLKVLQIPGTEIRIPIKVNRGVVAVVSITTLECELN